MKLLKTKIASIFLAILIVFNTKPVSYAAQFSFKRLFFATFGIHFKDENKQFRHKNRVKQYKKKLQQQENKPWPRKVYILGIQDYILKESIKSYFELNKLEKNNTRITLKDLNRLEERIENSNRFDYVNINIHYAPIGEEQILIYIKMPQAFQEVTVINKAANKLPYYILEKAVQPLITLYFDNTSLLNFAKTIKRFYKYLGYDYFFIRSYTIHHNKLIINMDEHRIGQFSIIGAIYFSEDDAMLTKCLNSEIPLKFASKRFGFRKKGSINTNYADRAVESLKSDLIVDVCRYEIDHIEGRKTPLDICVFMTSLPQRSGFFSVYPKITPDIIFNLLYKSLNRDIIPATKYNLSKDLIGDFFIKNNFLESHNLISHYLYCSNNQYLKLLKANIFSDYDFTIFLDKIYKAKHIIFGYYDLRNLIRKTDHLSLEIDFPYIDENFKIIYKDLWINIANKNLGIFKFTLLSLREMQDSSYFIGLNNLINRHVFNHGAQINQYLVREKLAKIEAQHALLDFISIYNRFGFLNKNHNQLEIVNSDNLSCNYQLLTSKDFNFLWIPRIKNLSQIIYMLNWAFICHSMQDINTLYKGTVLYLDFINIFSYQGYANSIRKVPLALINLIKLRQVIFIPFSINTELQNQWSGLFNIDFHYILQNSKKKISRNHIFNYSNMISDKQAQDNFPSNALSCEIHKRIKLNMSIFGGLSCEQSYFNSVNTSNKPKLNFSILIGLTINIPIQDVQPIYIYYGFPLYGKTSKIGFKMSLYRSVHQNLNKQI